MLAAISQFEDEGSQAEFVNKDKTAMSRKQTISSQPEKSVKYH
jgi:hypothetical protein